MAPDPNKKYKVEYIAAPDVTKFASDFDQQGPDPVGFHVFGEDCCPSCGHSFSDVFPLQAIRVTSTDGLAGVAAKGMGLVRGVITGSGSTFAVDAGYAPGPPAPPTEAIPPHWYAVISCRCTHFHDSDPAATGSTKPDGVLGCGSYWMVKATPDSAALGGMSLTAVPTTADYRTVGAAKAAALAHGTSLTSVQAIAGKWQTALTAILGVLVVTSLVGGRTTLEELDPLSKAIVAALAVLSLTTNVWAIYRFTLAASGRSEIVSTGNPNQLQQADLEPLVEARRALSTFESAVRAAALAFVSALAAMLCVWLLPDAEPDKPATNVQVTVLDPRGKSHTVCGSLEIDPAKRTFSLTPKAEDAQSEMAPLRNLGGVGAHC